MQRGLRVQAQEKQNVLWAYLSLSLRGEKVDALSLASETMRIADLTSDESIAIKAQRAVRIRGTVENVAFEESSQRFRLTFVANNSKELETIRSERIDSRNGKAVQNMFSVLQGGDEVIIFKLNESGNADGLARQGYRCAPYCVRINKR